MSTFNENAVRRNPAGTSIGGQFAVKDHAEAAELDLDTGGDSAAIGTVYSDIDRSERLEAMKADLFAAITDIVENNRLKEWMDTMSTSGLARWSFSNQLLALYQRENRRANKTPEQLADASDVPMVMTAKQWKEKFGRSVNKGEKAIWILAPCTRRYEKEDPTTGEKEQRVYVSGFRPQAEFDSCQTSGEPLPQSPLRFVDAKLPAQAVAEMKEKVAEFGFSYEERLIGVEAPTVTSTLGYTTTDGSKRVVVESRLTDEQKAQTLAHELGHIACGHVDNDPDEYLAHRGEWETEAEMASYLTLRHYGMDADDSAAFSPAYIASWSKGDPEVMEKSFGKATKGYQKMTGQTPAAYTKQPAKVG